MKNIYNRFGAFKKTFPTLLAILIVSSFVFTSGFASYAFADEVITNGTPVVEEVTPPSEPVVTQTENIITLDTVATPVTSPTLLTDKDDYHPGETATIFGKFFSPLQNFVLKIFGSDENDQNYTEQIETVTTDSNGLFSFSYLLDPLYRPFYRMAVSTPDGTALTDSYFRDSSVGAYDQCSNDLGIGYSAGDTGCRWTNGAINASNSTYTEGDSTVQRLWIEGYAPGTTHTVTFKYGTTKAGKHAYDYLTTWDASENWITNADRCQDITGCTTATESQTVMQNDPNVTDTIEPPTTGRKFTIRGGTIASSTVPVIVSGTYASDSETIVTVNFTVANSGSMCAVKSGITSCGIAIWFGAHVAKGSEWTVFNNTTGAGSISGSPYHVALDKEDGSSVGQRDNQMAASAIVIPNTITIHKVTTNSDTSTSFAFTTTGSGYSGFSSFGGGQNSQSPAPGSYTVTESSLSGWANTALTCTASGTGSSATPTLGTRSVAITIGSAGGAVIDCTFTNTLQQGHIIVDKVTVPSADTQSFAFTTTGTGYTDFSLTDAATPNDQTLNAGTYSVAETAVTGWTQTSAICLDGNTSINPSSINLVAGHTVTCTFTNTKKGHLIVDKVTNPGNDSTVFSILATSGNGTITGGGAGTVTDATNKNYEVTPGTYSVSETVAAGWVQTSNTCTGVAVAAGATETCVITNTKQANLTIVKNTVGGNGTFNFTTTGGLSPASPSITTSSNTGNQAYTNIAPGTYSVSETIPVGWDLTSATCSDGSPIGSISLSAGESVTCTFTNTKQTKLTLLKTVINNSGGAALDTAWTLTATGPTTISGIEGNAAVTNAVVAPGAYTLAESAGPSGYSPSLYSCVVNGGAPLVSNSLTLATGDNAVCTITNDDQAGHLIVHKVTNPSSDTTTQFSITASGGTIVSPTATQNIVGGGTVDYTVNAGTYNVSETAKAGWTEISNTCTGVIVANGATADCTVTNGKLPTLQLVKTVVNDNGGTLTQTNFPVFINTSSAVWDDVITLTPGNYTASETQQTGYSSTGWAGACATNGTVALAYGDVKTCTITNDDIAPKLTLVKQVINDNGGTAVASAWTLTATGYDSISPDAGTYPLSESGGPTGYAQTSLTCSNSGNAQVTSVTLGLGSDVTCTFVNDDIQPKLTVTKVVVNDNGGTKQVADFPLFVDGNGVTSGIQTGVNVGVHSLTETSDSTYSASTWGGDCAANGSITLAAGDVKACTITNNDIPAHLIVIKHVINDNGGSDVASGFTTTITGVTTATPSAPGAEAPGVDNTLTTVGTYSVDEGAHAGYTKTLSSDCSGTIALGQTKTCTITNDDQQAYIILNKTVINDNGGTAQPNDFLLKVDSAAALDEVALPVNPGAHLASETSLPGYTAGDWGADCDANGNVTVALGETKTCTITNNDIAPKLHLRKVVTNDNGGTATVADFTLTANGTGTNDLSGTSPVDSGAGLLADTFALSETNVTGYTASTWVCVGGTQSGSNITVGINQEATCTITNDDQPGTLIVKKVVDNGNTGATTGASAFSFSVNAGTPTSFESDGQNDLTVNAGTYTVTEPAVSGYTTTYNNCSAVVIPNGGTATCTVTNTAIAPTLKLVKTVINNNGGALTTSDFQGKIDTANVAWEAVLPMTIGAHTASEVAVAGYTASDWGGACSTNGSVSLALGENKICTITNDDIAPKLTLVKTVVNDNGGTAVASAWTLTATGYDSVSPDAGTYPLSESGGPTGYTQTSLTCDNATGQVTSVTLGLGSDVTCTFVNDDVAPKLHLIKILTINDGGVKTVADFTLTANGTGANDISGTSQVNSDGTLKADTFALSETNFAGYVASSWVCSGGTQSGSNITVPIGGEATCTITNDDIKANVVTHASSALITLGDSITDIVNVAGSNSGSSITPIPTGTVTFYVCPGTTCATGGTLLGTVTLDASGNATSPAYTPLTAGTYTFRAEYSGDATYLPAIDTNANTLETFTVALPVTRTQGFWSTHTAFTSARFAASPINGSMQIGTGGHIVTITNVQLAGQSKLFGAFYSSIPKKTTGAKRTDLDKARMQLLQQLVAAKLNCAAFGCSAGIQAQISLADTRYATGSASNILASASQMDAYNNSGDSGVIPSSLGSIGSATPKISQSTASLLFWDLP